MAYNEAGNTASHLIAVTVDNTAPTISIITPSNGSVLSVTKANVTWKGFNTLSGIDYYKVKLDYGSWTNAGTSTSHVFGNVALSVHVVLVKTVDRIGNASITFVAFGIKAPAHISTWLITTVTIFTVIAAALLVGRKRGREFSAVVEEIPPV